jgi:DNA modification methylase
MSLGSLHKDAPVFRPIHGSDTTIVAAEMTGRACFAIEIDTAYVDVAVLRWQAFTGKTAALTNDGRSLADLAIERRVGAANAPVKAA